MADARRSVKSVNRSAVFDERKKKLQEFMAKEGQVVTLPSTLPRAQLCGVVQPEVSIKRGRQGPFGIKRDGHTRTDAALSDSSKFTTSQVTSEGAENVHHLSVLGAPSTGERHQSKGKEDVVHGSLNKKKKKKLQEPGTAIPLKAVQKVIHKSTGAEVLPTRTSSVGNPKTTRPPLAANRAKRCAATIMRMPGQAGVSRFLKKVYKPVDIPKSAGEVRSSARVGLPRPPIGLQREPVHTQKHDRPVEKEGQMVRTFQRSEGSSMSFECVHSPQTEQRFSHQRSRTHTANIQRSRGHTCTPRSDRVRLTDAQQDRLNKLDEWRARNRRVYKRPPMEKRSLHHRGSCNTQAKELGLPVGLFSSPEREEDFYRRIDRLLARFEELIEEDEEVDLVMARRELPMLEKFPRFGLLLARQAQKQSTAALTPPLNGHGQPRQQESQPASELCRDHAAGVCESNAGSLDDGDSVSAGHGQGGLREHLQAEAASANSESEMYPQIQDVQGSSPNYQPQLQSAATAAAAAAAASNNRTPALGSTLRILLSDKKPLPGFLPSGPAKSVRYMTPVRRSLRLSLHHEPHHTASRETRPCLTSLREVLLGKHEAQRVAENEKSPTAFIFRGNELMGSAPGLWEAVEEGLVVLPKQD